MQKHFVEFHSPGTFVQEKTCKPIAEWDVTKAMKMAHGVTERYGATPYGFQFVTRERGDEDMDSREVARSPMYFLGGMVETLAQVKARNLRGDRVLIANMEGNGWVRVITNTNSYRWTQPFNDGDVRLDWTPKPKAAEVHDFRLEPIKGN